MISGLEAEVKVSDLMPRFWVYHCVVRGMEDTVRTRWSRDWIVAAGAEVLAILLNWWAEESFRRLTAGLRSANIA